jgi:integrase
MGLSTRTNADGSITYYYRFNRNGKIHTGSTFTNNKAKAAKYEDDKKREAAAAAEYVNSKSLTVKQALNKYLDSQSGAGQIANITTRVHKLLGHKLSSTTKQHLTVFGFDGLRRFESLTDADVQQLVLARRSEGTSNGTILTEMSTLSQAIKLNKKLGYLIPDIDFAEIKKDSKVKPHKGKLRYLSAEEEAAFLAQLNPDTPVRGIGGNRVKAQRQDAFDLAILLLDTGMRYGEAASLEWKQVDLQNKKLGVYRTKTKNESTLTMTDRIAEMLTRRSGMGHKVYVFEAQDGTARKYSPKAFRNAIERAGIEGCTIHSLRHTFASNLVQAGVSLYGVQSLLGHSSPSTTQRYSHLAPSAVAAQAAEILNKRSQA